MPASRCHPVGAHQRLRIPDTYVSSLMLDRALDAIARRVGAIDRGHDIPYLAGYSLDGKRIYIDRYLLLHEEVEKTLIDQLALHYQHAHQIATRAEEAAVRADGVSWRAYDRFMQQYVKQMGDERLTKLPADLDLKPYRDEHDYELMRRMKGATEDKDHPLSQEGALARRLVKALNSRAAILDAAKAAKPVSGRTAKRGAALL